MGASPPADRFAEIADRLVTQTEEQVIRLGRRSGHWTEADVDWVVAGSTGPRPDESSTEVNADGPGPPPESPASADDDQAAGDVGVCAALLLQEARASVALDGETHVVGPIWEQPRTVAPMTSEQTAAEVVRVKAAHPTATAAAAGPVDDRDLLARGLAHPDPKVRAAAERAAIAVDQLITALTRRPS